MTENLLDRTAAYGYPLLINHLLEAPLVDTPDREIVYRGHLLGEEEQVEIRCRTGLPLPLVHARPTDENGHEVRSDGATAGETVVRAAWLTQSYLKDTTNSEKLWQGFTSKHALLLKVRAVEAIDKTSVGKTNEIALREMCL